MRLFAAAVATVLSVVPLSRDCRAQQAAPVEDPAHAHASAEWANIAAHLPDPATASAAKLESTGDVLLARRYPQDALQFYTAALNRGGEPDVLFEKMGITCLQQQQVTLAHTYFQRGIGLNKKNPSAWNNLGASDFVLHDTSGAIRAYKHAVKLQKNSAAFHSNLALAYFEARKTGDARHELAIALQLDPDLLRKKNEGGYTAQVLASQRYPEICFEMARIYAAQGNMEATLDWLTKASERGFNVRAAMDSDPELKALLADPRVQVIVKNDEVLRAKAKAPGNIPSLGTPDR